MAEKTYNVRIVESTTYDLEVQGSSVKEVERAIRDGLIDFAHRDNIVETDVESIDVQEQE